MIIDNPNLEKYHTFGLPLCAQGIIILNCDEDINNFINSYEKYQPYCFLGRGSNSVFLKNYQGYAVIMNLRGFNFRKQDDNTILLSANAGESWSFLVEKSVELGYWGMENLIDIPSSVGAAVIQNIGAYGQEICNLVDKVYYIDIKTKKKYVLTKSQCEFGYRESIFKNSDKFINGEFLIIKVDFLLSQKPSPILDYPDLAKLISTQTPQKNLTSQIIANKVAEIRRSKIANFTYFGNAGSFFKNINVDENKLNQLLTKHPTLPYFKSNKRDNSYKIPSAWLIEKAGLKGYAIGSIKISPQHALILGFDKSEKYNNADELADSLRKIVDLVITTIWREYELTIVPEVIIYD